MVVLKRLLADRQRSDNWNQGYVDEKESLMNWQKLHGKYTDRLKQWLFRVFEKEPKWESLKNNGERVRYLYRHVILHCISIGYQYKKCLTPTEILYELKESGKVGHETERIMHMYNEVRYGGKEVSDSAVKQLKDYTDTLKNSR